MIVAVVLIIVAIVVYLLATIVALRRITSSLDDAITGVKGIIEKTAPVADVVKDINRTSTRASRCSRACSSRRRGSTTPSGSSTGCTRAPRADGLRNFPDSKTVTPPRISEVYTKGTLTLARLGLEAPIAAASPNGPALRNPAYGSAAARALYPEGRPEHADHLPRSPVIGTDSPVQYPERSEDADPSSV